jgi:hypothetical protein
MIEKRYSAQDEAFNRAMMFPEEERHRFTSKAWDGSFRWFRAVNVICLEHYRPSIGGSGATGDQAGSIDRSQ